MNISINYARTILLFLATVLVLMSSSAQALIQRSFVNLGFESVQISSGAPCRVYASQGPSIPGWSTTHPSYSGTDRVVCPPGVSSAVDTTSINPIIEVWKGPRDMGGGDGACSSSAENCISGRTGSQFVELNAASLSEIRQQVCLETGETVGWKFSHNGRNDTADRMRFKAGTQSIVQVATSTTGAGIVSSCDTGNCNTPLSARTTITGKARWADYSGSFTASGSNNTYIGFESLNGTSTSGNFLDDIQVTLKPAVEFKLGNYTDVENISASQSVEVQVVGIVPADIILNFTIDPTSTAVIGTDYSINGGTSTSFNISLPAGDYSGGKVISIPVKLLNNSVVEGSRSFKVILTPDATKFTIMPTSSCTNTGGNATSTYTIQDDDIGLQLEKSWVNASVNDKANLTSTGGATGAANINYMSTATAANVTNISNTIILAAGESRTLAETLNNLNAGAYNASGWSCNGGSLTGSVLTTSAADYGKVIKCTVTNSRTTSLQLAKVWSANSATTDRATIGATTGATNNTTAFTTPSGTNANSGAPVVVAVGNTINFPAETGTNIANYNTVLSCTANGGATANALSGTNGQVSNTLVIGAGDAGKSVVCTYTNTRITRTVTLTKSLSPTTDTGRFNLLINGSPVATNIGNGGTGSLAVAVGSTVSISETAGTGTTLNNYNSSLSCAGISGVTGTTSASFTQPNNDVNCTFTNTVISKPALIPDPVQKEARFEISPDLPTIYRGQAGNQLITIVNKGPDDATNTTVVFKPRAQTGVTVTSVRVIGGGNCSLSSGEWLCPVGNVANNGSFQLQVSYDTTASASLGQAIQADMRVGSNEFNPGSGVGESLYKIWGAETQEVNPSKNGAFMVGYKGTGGNVTGTGNGNFGDYSYEGSSIELAWPASQASPDGGYLEYGILGANSSYYQASTSTAPPMTDRLVTSVDGLSANLPLINPATNSLVDNRRAWEVKTGALIPQNLNAQQYTLCIGTSSQKLDDSAYIIVNGQRQGVARDTYSNSIYTVPVTLNTGYNQISYRIANRNSTNNVGGEVNAGGFGAIGLFNGSDCLPQDLNKLIRAGQTASINIINKPEISISGRVFEDNSGTTADNSKAYNGVQDSGEKAIAGSTVAITNCNSTTVATTSTDVNGDYSFSLLPAQLPTGNFCIAQTNLPGYTSVSGTTGYDRTSDTITVSNTGASSYVNQNFGDARLTALLTEDGQQTITAGSVADYPHRLTAQSVLTLTSLNQTATQQPANNGDQNWQAVLYRDSNCNGKVDSGETLLNQSLPLRLKNAEEICLVQRVYAPATASIGAQHIGQLQASFSATLTDNSQITSKSLQRQDTTLLGSAGLSMQKGVRTVAKCPSTTADTASFVTTNQAQSGNYLEYEITYRNNSSKNLVGVNIRDSVPAGTLYKAMSCEASPAGTCTPENNADSLIWKNSGTLLPGQQGKVRFCVQVP